MKRRKGQQAKKTLSLVGTLDTSSNAEKGILNQFF